MALYRLSSVHVHTNDCKILTEESDRKFIYGKVLLIYIVHHHKFSFFMYFNYALHAWNCIGGEVKWNKNCNLISLTVKKIIKFFLIVRSELNVCRMWACMSTYSCINFIFILSSINFSGDIRAVGKKKGRIDKIWEHSQ